MGEESGTGGAWAQGSVGFLVMTPLATSVVVPTQRTHIVRID